MGFIWLECYWFIIVRLCKPTIFFRPNNLCGKVDWIVKETSMNLHIQWENLNYYSTACKEDNFFYNTLAKEVDMYKKKGKQFDSPYEFRIPRVALTAEGAWSPIHRLLGGNWERTWPNSQSRDRSKKGFESRKNSIPSRSLFTYYTYVTISLEYIGSDTKPMEINWFLIQ